MIPSVTLSGGISIPAVGFGTYKAGEPAVLTEAIRAGYRLFDSASFYQTEKPLGEAVRQSGMNRGEFFITTKLWKEDMGYKSAKEACGRSLAALGMEYADLYLIHWPKPTHDYREWRTLIRDTWRAVEELCRDGFVRDVGVSNFLPHHLEVLLEDAQSVPSVNQIEFHPGYTQWSTVEYCRSHSITVQAWSPLGRTRMLDDPLLAEIAEKHGVSPAQVCLRFAYEEGVIPLPKASSPERMRENLDLFAFSLTAEERMRLASMPPAGWSGEHPDRPRVYFS